MLSIILKESTKEAHLQLERKVVQKLNAIRSKADYANLLKYFYAYFSELEKKIEPFITAQVLPDYKERRSSFFLKEDIHELGFDTIELPSASVPEINNTMEALGALYVMEGSIMGGSIIVKMLEKSGIKVGVSFFSGYGEKTRDKWTVFTAVLNNRGKSEQDKQAAVHAANRTFTCFSETFGETVHA